MQFTNAFITAAIAYLIAIPYSTQLPIKSELASIQKRSSSNSPVKDELLDALIVKTERLGKHGWEPEHTRHKLLKEIKEGPSLNAKLEDAWKKGTEQSKPATSTSPSTTSKVKKDLRTLFAEDQPHQKRSPGENAAQGGRLNVKNDMTKWELRQALSPSLTKEIKDQVDEKVMKAEELKALSALYGSERGGSSSPLFSNAMEKAANSRRI